MARPHARSNGLIGLPRAGVSRFWRVAVRLSAVAILGLAVGRGLVLGGHLDYEGSPWPKIGREHV